MAARREKGFYASLNGVSSVDMLPQIVKRRRVKGRGRLWEVERLVAQRQNATVSGILSVIILTLSFSELICKKSSSSEMIGKSEICFILVKLLNTLSPFLAFGGILWRTSQYSSEIRQTSIVCNCDFGGFRTHNQVKIK